MGTPGDGARSGARLIELQVADDPEAWSAMGFAVVGDVVAIDPIVVRLTGSDEHGTRGITGWTVAGLAVEGGVLDGLPTALVAPDTETASASGAHPNGVTGLDHVVVLTPHLDRTIVALEAAGLDLRRIRDTTGNGAPMRQAFFKLGPVVLEVVSGDVGAGLPAIDAPATFWGLAVDVDDLGRTADALGDGLGRVKVAVQRGRRIATFRTRAFGVSVAIAAMDRLADTGTGSDAGTQTDTATTADTDVADTPTAGRAPGHDGDR